MNPSAKQRYSLSRAGLTPFTPLIDYEEADERAKQIAAEMTDEEKFEMVCGRGFYIGGCARVGVPDINFTDASQGVHLREEYPAGKLSKSVSFPCAMALTATWNRKLVAEYARSVGEECRAGGIHVLLGPGMNTYRISQCGRNFEYTGEDPYLAAEMIYLYVTAVQQTGVIATLKHFIANETDYWRKLSNSVVGRRALKEIYLRAFQSGVEAGALAVMTSYNQLNGEYCGQSSDVINGLLRDELGFRHLVMTDWTSVTDGKKLAESGQDLEMPFGDCLKEARDEVIGSPEIDRMVTSIIRTFTMMGFLDFEHEQQAYLDNLDVHEEVALRTACEGTVLLRNEGGALPLAPDTGERIVLTGNWATRTPIAGKGSGYVEGYDNRSYAEAFDERFIFADVAVRHSPSNAELAQADTVIVFTGFEFEGEGRDRSFRLPESENELITRACDLADNVIVVVVSGGGVAMDWHDGTRAVILAPFGGQAGAEALAAVLAGDVNPSGKLPFTIENTFADSPGTAYIPAGGSVHDDVQGGQPGAAKPEHIDSDWPYPIEYEEGVYVGYRWYDAKQKPVRYWFGHGLSYTTFSYADLSVETKSDGLWEVSVTVKNVGEISGAEVVQLYIEDRTGAADRPRSELKGFDKVFLEPGEQQEVTILIAASDLDYFDESANAYTHASGVYGVHVGSSYGDIRLTGEIVAP